MFIWRFKIICIFNIIVRELFDKKCAEVLKFSFYALKKLFPIFTELCQVWMEILFKKEYINTIKTNVKDYEIDITYLQICFKIERKKIN